MEDAGKNSAAPFGLAIGYLLREKGWVEKQLAAETGISQAHINRMKKGESEGSPASMRKIADAFDSTVADMLTIGDLLADGKDPRRFQARPLLHALHEQMAEWRNDAGFEPSMELGGEEYRLLGEAFRLLMEGGDRAEALRSFLGRAWSVPGPAPEKDDEELSHMTRDRLVNHLLDEIAELKSEIKKLKAENPIEEDEAGLL